MKTWVRLTLITMSVGGGFTGAALTFQSLLNSHGQSALNLMVMIVFFALNVFVTATGLVFVQDAHEIRPLMAALAMQIPWISSPVGVYRFVTGAYAVLSVKGGEAGKAGIHIGWQAFLGSSWTFALSQDDPLVLGVNLWALAMVILLWKSVPKPTSVTQPVNTLR